MLFSQRLLFLTWVLPLLCQSVCAGWWGELLHFPQAFCRGASPPAPRKASFLSLQSTTTLFFKIATKFPKIPLRNKHFFKIHKQINPSSHVRMGLLFKTTPFLLNSESLPCKLRIRAMNTLHINDLSHQAEPKWRFS